MLQIDFIQVSTNFIHFLSSTLILIIQRSKLYFIQFQLHSISSIFLSPNINFDHSRFQIVFSCTLIFNPFDFPKYTFIIQHENGDDLTNDYFNFTG